MIITIYNFIPYLKDKDNKIKKMDSLEPEKAARLIRDSCTEKAGSFIEWGKLIKEHCIIPKQHPFVRLMEEKNIPKESSLWILGAIAYGTESAWIVIESIKWDNREISFPDKEHKKWNITKE